MAEAKVDGVRTVKQFSVDPRKVEVELGFNRPLNREHIESIKETMLTGVEIDPIWVRVDNGRIILVDGEHRVTAAKELLSDGKLPEPPDGYRMAAQQFRGNDAERIAHLITSSQGLALTPLQRGIQYRKLTGFGWTTKDIAQKVGRTVQHVSDVLLLAESDSDVQGMVAADEVAAHTAIKAVKKHGSGAGAILSDGVQAARLDGKKKATAKHLDGNTPKNLPQAIQFEIDSGGKFRAEDLCPRYKDLIAYLRNSCG